MKRFLLTCIVILVSYQFDSLTAMQYLRSNNKHNIHTLASRNIAQQYQSIIKKEADHAASTIKKWLTPELMNELVQPAENFQVTDSVQLNTKILDELSLGQRTFLTSWTTYPCYIPLVYAHSESNFEYYYNGDSGAPVVRAFKKFVDALIIYNFGKTFFKKVKQFTINKELGVWELRAIVVKLAPYLMSLFYKKKTYCTGSQELLDILECYDKEVEQFFPEFGQVNWESIIFLLENPYFFMTHILTWSNGTPEALDILILLIVYGFNVNCQLGTGCDVRDTLLHRAVRYDYVEMVEYLLEFGADPRICYGRDEEPYKGGGQSPWEISKYKMRGETWIVPNRPPSEKTRIIHAMLSAIVCPDAAKNEKELQQRAYNTIESCKKKLDDFWKWLTKAKE